MKTTINQLLNDVAQTYREAVKGNDKAGHAGFDTGNMAGFDNLDGTMVFDASGQVVEVEVSFSPKR